jgi:hypothetical protein
MFAPEPPRVSGYLAWVFVRLAGLGQSRGSGDAPGRAGAGRVGRGWGWRSSRRLGAVLLS